MEIKPIETVYNGYKFRSRLEARWAVFFDALGIKYEYEKEGFDLGELGWYLPDFFLPNSKWFVEVKGNNGDAKGLAKARSLDDNPPNDALGCYIIGDLEYAKYEINRDDEPPSFNHIYLFTQAILPRIDLHAINRAIDIAKQARFEHGENPRIFNKCVCENGLMFGIDCFENKSKSWKCLHCGKSEIVKDCGCNHMFYDCPHCGSHLT